MLPCTSWWCTGRKRKVLGIWFCRFTILRYYYFIVLWFFSSEQSGTSGEVGTYVCFQDKLEHVSPGVCSSINTAVCICGSKQFSIIRWWSQQTAGLLKWMVQIVLLLWFILQVDTAGNLVEWDNHVTKFLKSSHAKRFRESYSFSSSWRIIPTSTKSTSQFIV